MLVAPIVIAMALNDEFMTDTDSEDDSHPVQYDCMHDDRLNTLNMDSVYCDIDHIQSSDLLQTFSKSKYCALHINIHSLPSKYTQLRNMLSRLRDQQIDVQFVLLCETFLTPANADKFPIPGYNCIHKCRTMKSRGGIAIYIADNLNYIERPDLCVNVEGQFECMSVEIKSCAG